MKKHRKWHEKNLKAFRKQEATWDEEREVFARLAKTKQRQIRKLDGLRKISHGALADLNGADWKAGQKGHSGEEGNSKPFRICSAFS